VLLVGRGAIAARSQKHRWRWVVDARGNGRRYVVGSDELLSAFLELEKNIVMRGRRYLGGYKVFAY